MHCSGCSITNDPEARFCIECGRPFPLVTAAAIPSMQPRKSYLFMITLIPVLALVAGIGYYKFILPDGVAAFVNNEEIRLSELDEAVSRVSVTENVPPNRLRYQILNQLISDRIIVQEARKAGMTVSQQEIVSAVDNARAVSGLDEASFRNKISSEFGSIAAFEYALSRQLLMDKFIAAKVVPPGADQRAAHAAMAEWFDRVSRKAAVRIALAEQGAGCGGCKSNNKMNGQPTCRHGAPGTFCAEGVQAGAVGYDRRPHASAASGQTTSAEKACLQYWHAKYGPAAVTARTTDFGCHVQVDLVKNDIIIGSLRYRNGSIAEQKGRREQ